jgi:hypothetical protein
MGRSVRCDALRFTLLPLTIYNSLYITEPKSLYITEPKKNRHFFII